MIIDRRKLGFFDAPQVWLAAVLALAGVGLLELGGGDVSVGWGDVWSVLQAIGFGTSFYITERMMAKEPDQVLPITAAQCAVSALVAGVWALGDGLALGPFASLGSSGWLLDASLVGGSFTLPGLAHAAVGGGELQQVAWAAAWTGLFTTAMNRVGETVALGKLASSEAAVLLATEPLWAAAFASALIGESMGPWDVAGGALIVAACLANAAEPATLRRALGRAGGGGLDDAADEASPRSATLEASRSRASAQTEPTETSE